MALIPQEYVELLGALLPRGPAWQREPGAHIDRLLAALAIELHRVDLRADALAGEADTRQTTELLADWERALGLPTTCMAGIEQTDVQRRAALLAQLLAQGGQTPAYFIGLAAAAGYTVTISEYTPTRSNMRSNMRTYGAAWAHAWRVNAPASTVWRFRSNARSGDRLASWGNALLECVIRRHAPAHTIVIFAYGVNS